MAGTSSDTDVLSGVDIANRLSGPGLADLLVELRLGDQDRAGVLDQAGGLSTDDHQRIAQAANRLVERLGTFVEPAEQPRSAREPVFAGCDDQPGRPRGLLPLFALLATVDEVRAYHVGRGISAEDSISGLRDLGQQMLVHRLTFGELGLHTQWWLTTAWSGALYWLGRLQFNLTRHNRRWVWSTHIPQSGPLTPASVDDAFERANAFFPRHFPDMPAADFHCSSWLLDPQLVQALGPHSNMSRFQQRWHLEGEPTRGDADVLFFVFHRRGDVDLGSLPRDTTLRRAVIDKIAAGGHWNVWHGLIPRTETSGG